MTTKPIGSESVKLIPVNFAVLSIFRLVIVNVSMLVPFKEIGLGEKLLSRCGGPTTVISALAGGPGTVLDEVITALLVYLAGAIPITCTTNVQVAPRGRAGSEKIMEPLPGGAIIVDPIQPAEVDTTPDPTLRDPKKLSTIRMLSMVFVFATGLVMVKVKLLVPLSGI